MSSSRSSRGDQNPPPPKKTKNKIKYGPYLPPGVDLQLTTITPPGPAVAVTPVPPARAPVSTVTPAITPIMTRLTPARVPRSLPPCFQKAKEITIIVRSTGEAEFKNPMPIKVWATPVTTSKDFKKAVLEHFGVAHIELDMQFPNTDSIPDDDAPIDMGTDIFRFPNPQLFAFVPPTELKKIPTTPGSRLNSPFLILDMALANSIPNHVLQADSVSEQLNRLTELESLLTLSVPPEEEKALFPYYQSINFGGQDHNADPWKLYQITRNVSPAQMLDHSHQWLHTYITEQREKLIQPSAVPLVDLDLKESKSVTHEVDRLMLLPHGLQRQLQGKFDSDMDSQTAQERLIRLETILRWATLALKNKIDYGSQCEYEDDKRIYSLLNSKEVQKNFEKFIQQMQRKYLQPSLSLPNTSEINKFIFVRKVVDYLNSIKLKITFKFNSKNGKLWIKIKEKKRGKIVKAMMDLQKILADNFLNPGFEFRYLDHLTPTHLTPGLITSADIVLLETPNTRDSSISEVRLFVNVDSCLSNAVKVPSMSPQAVEEEANSVSYAAAPGGPSLFTPTVDSPAPSLATASVDSPATPSTTSSVRVKK